MLPCLVSGGGANTWLGVVMDFRVRKKIIEVMFLSFTFFALSETEELGLNYTSISTFASTL